MRDDICLQFLVGLLSKQSMDSTLLKPGDHGAYETLTQAAKGGMSEQLIAFKTAAVVPEVTESNE